MATGSPFTVIVHSPAPYRDRRVALTTIFAVTHTCTQSMTESDGANHFAIVQVVAPFVVNTEYTFRGDKFRLVTW
jgi:hypothetical protein